MRKVDLRSDTLTLPTEKMREEMAKAEVGKGPNGLGPTWSRAQVVPGPSARARAQVTKRR